MKLRIKIPKLPLRQFITVFRLMILTGIISQLLINGALTKLSGINTMSLSLIISTMYALGIGLVSFDPRFKNVPDQLVLTADFIFTFLLALAAGTNGSPFILYSYIPVVAVGLILSLRAGIVGGSLMMVLYLASLRLTGHTMAGLRTSSDLDDLIGMSFMYVLIGAYGGYIGNKHRFAQKLIERNIKSRDDLRNSINRFRKLRKELLQVQDLNDRIKNCEDTAQLTTIFLLELAKRFDIKRVMAYVLSNKATECDIYATSQSIMPQLEFNQPASVSNGALVFHARYDTTIFRESLNLSPTFTQTGGPHAHNGLILDSSDIRQIEPQTLQVITDQFDAAVTAIRLSQLSRNFARAEEHIKIWQQYMPDIGSQIMDCAENCRTIAGLADVTVKLIEAVEAQARELSVNLRVSLGQLRKEPL
jgi:hypothetical protein